MRGSSTELPTLNLNSMMDMLSIILVFLLANISAEEQDFVIAKNLTLPNSDSSLGFTKAVQVKLTTQGAADRGHLRGQGFRQQGCRS